VAASTDNDGAYSWVVPEREDVLCWVRVRSLDRSDLSDESSLSITTVDAFAADLVVVSVTPSDYAPASTDELYIDVAIRNAGNVGASGFDLELREELTDPAALGTQSDLDLGKGEETTVRFGSFTGGTGVWRVYAIVDTSLPGITESNEDNNRWEPPVEVAWDGVASTHFCLTSPNGGEVIEQGATHTVRWDPPVGNPGKNVKLQVSTDGGVTYTSIVEGIPRDLWEFEWSVNAPASTECRLRIANLDHTVADVSDEVFTILPEGASALPYIGKGCGATGGPVRVRALLILILPIVFVRRRALARQRVGRR
jgi:hypothetical protein